MRARLGRSAAIDSQNGVTTARQSGNLSLYFIQHIVCSAFSSSHHQFNENDRLGSSRKSTDSGDRLNHCRLRYLTILIAGFVSAHVFMVCDSPIMQAQGKRSIHPIIKHPVSNPQRHRMERSNLVSKSVPSCLTPATHVTGQTPRLAPPIYALMIATPRCSQEF
jgi:hypothetical protein